MDYLERMQVRGDPEHAKRVKEIFGKLYLGGTDENLTLTITRVFPNTYRTASPGENDLLYIAVPEETIDKVWPEPLKDYDVVKYGSATVSVRSVGDILIPAIALHKGTVGLYLCLVPEGVLIKSANALGI